MHEMTLRSLELPARDWQVQLGEEMVLLPPQGEPLRLLRADLPRSVELVALWGKEGALVVRPVGRKKVSFRLPHEERRTLEAWLGPPTTEHLRHVLRRRYVFAIPLALLFILVSLPLAGDPAQGVPPHTFDWIPAGLGVGLFGLWLAARVRPSPTLFAIDAFWFGLVMLLNLWDVYRGASSLLWLPIVLLFGWLSLSGIKQYRQYKQATTHQLLPAA